MWVKLSYCVVYAIG